MKPAAENLDATAARAIPDQRDIRSARPIRDLSEFLAFLEDAERVAGRAPRELEPTVGTKFRL